MNSDFGPRIKTLRKKKGLTQSALAHLLGVTKTMVSAYETGIRKPSYENLMELALLFDVSMDYLFGCSESSDLAAHTALSALTKEQQTLVEGVINEFRQLNQRNATFIPGKNESCTSTESS